MRTARLGFYGLQVVGNLWHELLFSKSDTFVGLQLLLVSRSRVNQDVMSLTTVVISVGLIIQVGFILPTKFGRCRPLEFSSQLPRGLGKCLLDTLLMLAKHPWTNFPWNYLHQNCLETFGDLWGKKHVWKETKQVLQTHNSCKFGGSQAKLVNEFHFLF